MFNLRIWYAKCNLTPLLVFLTLGSLTYYLHRLRANAQCAFLRQSIGLLIYGLIFTLQIVEEASDSHKLVFF